MALIQRKESLLEDASFTEHEQHIIRRILDVLDEKASSFEKRGLTKTTFCLGVTNSLFVSWAFGAIPQHFWIVYMLEIMVLFPMRWQRQVTAVPKQHLYWLDFCWVANFASVLAIVGLVINACFALDAVTESQRMALFSVVWGFGCGPLLMAVGLLNNALVFHDVDNTASVLIHLFPSLVLYCFHWQREAILAAWPTLFHLDYFSKINIWSDIYLNASIAYGVWWFLYTAWLLLFGMHMPAKGYDTIFHYSMQASLGDSIANAIKMPREELKQRRKENNFPRAAAVLYMTGHAIGVYTSILVALLCFQNKYFHGSMCAAMTFLTIYNGSSRYAFYLLKMYTKLVRAEVRDLRNEHM